MADRFAVTERTRVRRKPMRADYDRAAIYAILDEALIASVGVVIDGRPHVQPMIHVRIGDDIILHGIAANRLLGLLAAGGEACLNVTLIDALVLARTIEDHSLHYRSVTLFARATEIEDPGEKAEVMKAVFTSLVRSGRYATLPPLDLAYLKMTRVLRLPIEEASAKINQGIPDATAGPAGIWSGTIPLALSATTPIPDPRTTAEALDPGDSITNYRRRPAPERSPIPNP
jgi:nitroimidazol reductase NimA-like FMN-containing flavoprotein (pyridoxamine 5'-phosphate oxidase superfamily)